MSESTYHLSMVCSLCSVYIYYIFKIPHRAVLTVHQLLAQSFLGRYFHCSWLKVIAVDTGCDDVVKCTISLGSDYVSCAWLTLSLPSN